MQGEQYFETMPCRVENPGDTGESCPWPNAFTVCLGEVHETILTTTSWPESTLYFPSQKVLPGPDPLSAAPSSFQNEQPHFLFLVIIFHPAFFPHEQGLSTWNVKEKERQIVFPKLSWVQHGPWSWPELDTDPAEPPLSQLGPKPNHRHCTHSTPHAPGDNYCWVSPPIPSHAAELARAKGMRADVLPPDRCQLCPMENVIWDEWEPASSQTGLCGMVVGPPHSDHYPFQQPPLSWQTPATAFHKNIISALPLLCKLEKVKRAKGLHENQKNAQVNRREVEKCGKEMHIHRGWRGKVYLRADSPEEIHKSQNKGFVTAMFWGMWLRVLNFWG